MSNLGERKVSYLQAEEVRKEEATGTRGPILFNMVPGWPLASQDEEGTVWSCTC